MSWSITSSAVHQNWIYFASESSHQISFLSLVLLFYQKNAIMVIWTKKVFRDPVLHISTSIIQVIYDLISHKKNLTSAPYQTARDFSYTFRWRHSRFSHCLGVHRIARRITEIFNILKNGICWVSLDHLTAALLHDLGHGSFTHATLNISLIQRPIARKCQVTDRDSQNPAEAAPDFPKRWLSVIDHTYLTWVVQLISSRIDADRMDYLLRDSYFTGHLVKEVTWLTRGHSSCRNGIAFQHNGMHAIEDYVLSRYQMYMQVLFPQHAPWSSSQNLLKR